MKNKKSKKAAVIEQRMPNQNAAFTQGSQKQTQQQTQKYPQASQKSTLQNDQTTQSQQTTSFAKPSRPGFLKKVVRAVLAVAIVATVVAAGVVAGPLGAAVAGAAIYGAYRGVKAINNRIANNRAQKALLNNTPSRLSQVHKQPVIQQQQSIGQAQQQGKVTQISTNTPATKVEIGGHRQDAAKVAANMQRKWTQGTIQTTNRQSPPATPASPKRDTSLSINRR